MVETKENLSLPSALPEPTPLTPPPRPHHPGAPTPRLRRLVERALEALVRDERLRRLQRPSVLAAGHLVALAHTSLGGITNAPRRHPPESSALPGWGGVGWGGALRALWCGMVLF